MFEAHMDIFLSFCKKSPEILSHLGHHASPLIQTALAELKLKIRKKTN